MTAGSPRQLRAWVAPLQLPREILWGFPLPVTQAQAQRAELLVCPWPLLSCQAQGLTVASRLIGGAADGADWSPAGTWAALREQKRLGGEGPAPESGAPPRTGLKRSRPHQELLTLALEG
ncbi:unnamed protein product [Rangifer tarandus platyrhynchus]|uniref:Uncharacterized protein n=2 Tax=Rangifer tarandus platyrhynchus TaxID=3082113 RepID=A0ABN8Y7Q8_RANTA|nr:unnamed protein product [Rangifer tarandus platyrhynchus]CAI9696604.1 unnamed protein product [Rangifer tarandus platyrhynchus]